MRASAPGPTEHYRVAAAPMPSYLTAVALRLAAAALMATAVATAGSAASLRIEPVIIDVPAPGAAGLLTLHNDDMSEVTVQIRVFRWTQVNGKDALDPTTDVVASPPAIKLSPG